MRTLTAPTLSAILAVTIVTLTGNCLLAQSVPAPMQLVGEGTISTDGGEIFPSFSISGDTLYFSTHEDGWSRHNIVVSHLTDDGWSSPAPTSFNSSFDDRAPFVSPDGNTLIFSSNRPLPGAAGQTVGDFNLWLVVRTESGRWSRPEPVPGVNSTANDFHAAIVSSGAVYFSSDRAGGLGENDIYRAEPNDDGFDAPVNLGAPVNSAGEETDLAQGGDGKIITHSHVVGDQRVAHFTSLKYGVAIGNVGHYFGKGIRGVQIRQIGQRT